MTSQRRSDWRPPPTKPHPPAHVPPPTTRTFRVSRPHLAVALAVGDRAAPSNPTRRHARTVRWSSPRNIAIGSPPALQVALPRTVEEGTAVLCSEAHRTILFAGLSLVTMPVAQTRRMFQILSSPPHSKVPVRATTPTRSHPHLCSSRAACIHIP